MFLEELNVKLRVSGTFFSLILDETTDISVKKQCAFSIIYFDDAKNKVVSEFFDLVETGGSSAVELFETLKKNMSSKKLPFENLLDFLLILLM